MTEAGVDYVPLTVSLLWANESYWDVAKMVGVLPVQQ